MSRYRFSSILMNGLSIDNKRVLKPIIIRTYNYFKNYEYLSRKQKWDLKREKFENNQKRYFQSKNRIRSYGKPKEQKKKKKYIKIKRKKQTKKDAGKKRVVADGKPDAFSTKLGRKVAEQLKKRKQTAQLPLAWEEGDYKLLILALGKA